MIDYLLIVPLSDGIEANELLLMPDKPTANGSDCLTEFIRSLLANLDAAEPV
jgi:hypothetical protein